ncbi:hypothetical protein J2Q11_13110 [Tenacibaculum finnmarkense genomovar finnmarkense]|uniref:hypothetical protein n=2 Tax=Tenacibaculum finnmarkense TaxID=2781243 RepID=UPI001E28287B|nr:hypothetical protein [Tenacibaculum finnmarkense]MCD8418600.1 hypothetical protein [Tenacibaculum finnmarkense genomovar finnmarkense]MCG8186957.1 hypothetical protein [Tenacibaculum finnmarkense genomovar finnmarkense]MCG8203490.1 hypothetical protein [Tenacibaculum finnmarkense genomovar finnmarkense]MCG8210964.1 hypothetical protein [Tenacibaculum finnmarkense genomovar finnmarkense]MCG8213765.1 hypothetical protein [Tenacibaculum finnmarkense genomovar finnmarkense]
MKKIIIILLIITSCKTIYMPQKQHNFYIPTIDNSFETFKLEEYNKENENGFSLRKNQNKTILRVGGNTYSEGIYFDNSPFNISKNFYDNGNIESKWISFNHGSRYVEKGIWYDYDREGRLIKTIDYDKGYAFTWEDVLNYCVTNNIPITLGYNREGGHHTSIQKEESEEFKRKVWAITYMDTTGVGIGKGLPLEAKILDGNTGKVLKTEKGGLLEPREN